MKKYLLTVLLCVSLIAMFTACGISSSSSDGQSTDASSKEETSTPSNQTNDPETELEKAYRNGKEFIDTFGVSREGLIYDLSLIYDEDTAELAVEQLEANGVVDWDAECEEAAKALIEDARGDITEEELIEELYSYEYSSWFTYEQAEGAVERVYNQIAP